MFRGQVLKAIKLTKKELELLYDVFHTYIEDANHCFTEDDEEVNSEIQKDIDRIEALMSKFF